MAAAQNDSIAVNNVGSLYYSGVGTEKNYLKAAAMFDRAAKLGNVEASVNLAVYLSERRECRKKQPGSYGAV